MSHFMCRCNEKPAYISQATSSFLAACLYTEKKNQPKTMASSWWFQPMSFEKYARQIGSSPQVRMKIKNL